MNNKQLIGTVALSFILFTTGIAQSEVLSPKPGFTTKMVSGKSFVSSGYPTGHITFNANGSQTCTNYPPVVNCLTWQIEADGTILRTFADSSGSATKDVWARWTLLKYNKTSYTVSQTSSNAKGATTITVTPW